MALEQYGAPCLWCCSNLPMLFTLQIMILLLLIRTSMGYMNYVRGSSNKGDLSRNTIDMSKDVGRSLVCISHILRI